jgi:hypothetical protein
MIKNGPSKRSLLYIFELFLRAEFSGHRRDGGESYILTCPTEDSHGLTCAQQ